MNRSSAGSRRATTTAGAAAVFLLTACVGPPGVPAPAGLAYGEPEPNPAVFVFSDSATFAIQAPGYGVLEVETARRGTAQLHFQNTSDKLWVRLRFTAFEGSVRTPSQGSSSVDAADLGGPLGVEVSFEGAVTVVDSPSVTPALLDVAGLESLVRPFFPPLPGGRVGPGARWVDTVRTREEVRGIVTRGTSVITSTLAGDTTVAGRRVLRIVTETDVSVEASGASGGVDVEQALRGTLMGEVFWDEAAHLLIERAERGVLSGSLAMPGVGVDPLPVTARVRRQVSLRR